MLKKGKKLADIKGRKINMVELSVSHYLLARALASVKLRERDIKVVNTSDADIVGGLQVAGLDRGRDLEPACCRRPTAEPGATLVFNSSKIPGEIHDLLVVNTAVLKDNPDFGKALLGIWYRNHCADAGRGRQRQSGTRGDGEAVRHRSAGFDSQLKTTRMFYTPKEALAFMAGPDMAKTMDLVRTFCFEHNLLGEKVKSQGRDRHRDAVGTLGSRQNVKLRFDPTFMKLAADGKL